MRETSERKDTMMTAQRFLVPLDFSEDANQALAYAIGLASKLGARVTLLHVLQSPPWGASIWMSPSLMPIAGLSSTWKQRSHTACRPAWSVSLQVGWKARWSWSRACRSKNSRDRQEPAGGSHYHGHGRTGLQHVLLGSVAEKVVHLAPCPVLVVRQPPLVPIA